MVTSDDTNAKQGVPVLFPPWLARLQRKYMNPVMKRAVRHLPVGSVVLHRGRKSGRPYETVVAAYRKGNVLAIALGHGEADWVKNVLAAGEADVRLFRREVHVANPRIVPMGKADRALPWIVRLQGRRAAILVVDIV